MKKDNNSHNEHIGGHKIYEDVKEEKGDQKLYKSKFPPNLPPSWSTFNNKTTAHPGINNIGGDYQLHTGYHKHNATKAYWGPQRGVKDMDHDNPLQLATGIIEQRKCNLVNRKPQILKHVVQKQDKVELEKIKQNHKLDQEKIRKKRAQSAQPKMQTGFSKPGFGKVPEYLEEMKKKKEEDERIQAERDKKPPKKKVTKEALNEIMVSLRKKFQELNGQYCQYSHKIIDTPILKTRKIELEKEILKVEKDIEKVDKYLQKK